MINVNVRPAGGDNVWDVSDGKLFVLCLRIHGFRQYVPTKSMILELRQALHAKINGLAKDYLSAI